MEHGYRRNLSLVVTTEPLVEPVSVSDVQDRAGVTGDAALIGALITAARQKIEAYLDRALITQSLRLSMNGFPYGYTLGAAGHIDLPRAPLQAVESVLYYDIDDAEQTYAASEYLVLTNYTPGKVQVKYGQTWPTNVRAENAVQINYTAGYGDDASDVPEGIRQALLLETVQVYSRKRPDVDSESIDNASRNYTNANTLMEATAGTGFTPTVLTLLQPFRVISL